MLEKLCEQDAQQRRAQQKLQKRLARLDEDMEQMNQNHAEADKRAQQEREAVDRVETELLEMFSNPELRKRYFAIVDVTEIEENEFNLYIPRYVDTFEPEEEIKVADAAAAFQSALDSEDKLTRLSRNLAADKALRANF